MSGYTLTHGDSRTQTVAALIHQRFWGCALIWPRQTHQPSWNLPSLPASPQGSRNTNLQLKAQQPEICHRRLRQTCKSSVFPKKSITCCFTYVSDGVSVPTARCQHCNRSCSCWTHWDVTLSPSLREAALCRSLIRWEIYATLGPFTRADPDGSVLALMPSLKCVCNLSPLLWRDVVRQQHRSDEFPSAVLGALGTKK